MKVDYLTQISYKPVRFEGLNEKGFGVRVVCRNGKVFVTENGVRVHSAVADLPFGTADVIKLLDSLPEPEPLLSKCGDIITTRTHWDCECDKNYIHNSWETFCLRCNSFRAEQPNSRYAEAKDLMLDNQRKIAEQELKDGVHSRGS